MRVGHWITLLAVVVAGCGNPLKPSPEIVISNLKSNVLGSSLEVCGRGPGLTLTQFTFDFVVKGGIDVSTDSAVYRIVSSTPPGDVVLGPVVACSSGPCASIPRACITAGNSTTSGTIEVAATEPYRPESTWTIEVRQNGQTGVRSNALTAIVSYPPE